MARRHVRGGGAGRSVRVATAALAVAVALFVADTSPVSPRPALPAPRVDSAATATQTAVRAVVDTDVVAVYQASDLTDSVRRRAEDAARAAGGRSAIGRSAAIQLVTLRRGSRTVQAAPDGWSIPFGTTVLPLNAVEAVMGHLVASAIGRSGNIVMARSSAEMRGAEIGDVMRVRTAAGGTIDLAISQIVPDDMIGGTEIVMHPDDATRIGIVKPGRVVIWGFSSRRAIVREMRSRGLVDTSETGVLGSSDSRMRVRRSWDPADPDAGLSLLDVKLLLGEFPFVVHSDGGVSIGGAFVNSKIDCGPINYCRRQLNSSIPIRARCHVDVVPAVEGALQEIADAGLAGAIDVGNANTFGGCYYPRFNRLATSTFVGFLSRHTWGMALDTNTTQNAQGATPQMNCDVVRIFRKWGFAWGGNFITPDGMHFEYVGEPRDQLPYDSKWCSNDVAARAEPLDPSETQRPGFFGGDGLTVEH